MDQSSVKPSDRSVPTNPSTDLGLSQQKSMEPFRQVIITPPPKCQQGMLKRSPAVLNLQEFAQDMGATTPATSNSPVPGVRKFLEPPTVPMSVFSFRLAKSDDFI